MFCPNCKQARIENETPCPLCGAPSPLLQLSGIGQWGTNSSAGGAWTASSFGLNNHLQANSWGGPATYQASPAYSRQEPMGSEQQWGAPVPQLNLDKGTLTPSTSNASWSQMSPATSSQSIDNGAERSAASQTLLPVVYQEPQANDMRQSTIALQLIPQQAVEHLLPAIAEAPESVYMPPLFTRPRPITPKYRIISGTLSVLIVALMLCGGVGYYAQTSGTLGRVLRMFTNAPPPSVQNVSSQKLPAPPDQIDTGLALGIIPSGTTTLRIDSNNLPLETDKVFTVGQSFYVTYTVQPPGGQEGRVSVKWYMNKQLYHVATSDVIKGDRTSYGSHQMQYLLPAEGSVELYWNDLLAQRFYFVVQPAN